MKKVLILGGSSDIGKELILKINTNKYIFTNIPTYKEQLTS